MRDLTKRIIMRIICVHIIKRASGESEPFSLVMKSNNYLWIACLNLAYVSPLGLRDPYRRMQLAPPTLGHAHTKNHAPTTLDSDRGITDATMPCLSKAFQLGPHQKLFFV